MQLLVGHPDADPRAEALLHRLHPGHELRERAGGRAAALDPRAGDIRAVPREARAGVDQQRPRRLRALFVADVVEGGGVLAQRDDVLVRRLGIVLAGGAEEGEVQLELAPIRTLEEAPQLLVARSGPPICFGEAGDLVGSFADTQRVQIPD